MASLSTSPRQQPITVAVIDKNPLVVRGLDQMLREDGRFELVMSAPNGDDFLSEYAARGVAAPIDIAVTGWVMPKGDGRSLLRRIHEMANPPKVVVYTGELSDMTLRAAVREGAAAPRSRWMAYRITPAVTNRVPAMVSGGSVSMANRIAR